MSRAALAAIVLPIAAAACLPVERGLAIKGDEATYIAMAMSVAYDGDLKFGPQDLHRFQRLYGTGPEGIFLQQGYDLHLEVAPGWPPVRVSRTRRPSREGLAFGKAFAYPVVAAPFIRLAGLRGLLLLNLLLLSAVVWMGWTFAATRLGVAAAGVLTVAFVAASIVSLYTVWRTPEIFNFALVFAAYFLWLYKEVASPPELQGRWLAHPVTDYIAAGLLGVATFSKPPNALLVGPLIVMLLLRRRWPRWAGVGATFLLFSAGAFVLNALVSGELNYQGGDRRTFYGRFPYSDATATFDSMGSVMATEHSDAQSLLSPPVFWPLFEHNAGYYFVGRHAGLIPYFLPGIVILAAWLARPRTWTRWQILSALALGGSVLALLALAPYSWNGAGGPPGNRYFLSLYPVLFFLLPPGAPRWLGGVAMAGLIVTAPLLAHPLAASQQPWRSAEHGLVRLLPVELTMVDDLPVRLAGARSRIPFRDALLYLLDEAAFQPESTGFWVAGRARAEIIVRTDGALGRVKFRLRSVVPNHVELSVGGRAIAIDLEPNTIATVWVEAGPGVVYTHGSRAYLLSISTSQGFVPHLVDAASTDARFLGVFVEPDF